MTKYSLRARMMILILAPTLLIGLLLSTFFVVHRYNELQEQLVDAGASIIEPLAVASEYGMTFRSRESVRQLVSLLHRRHSDIVRSITVFDAQNNLFVTSNYHHNFAQLQLPKGVPLPTDLMLTRRGDSLILRTPILSESQYPDETADGGSHPDNNLGYVAIELDLQSVRLQQYKEVFVSTLLLLLCMCIAILFAYRLMRDVTGPIRNMVNTVDRIRRGQLDSRVEGYMLGELHMLKNGINSMAMSLTAYHEEMQQNIDQATSDLRETLEQMEIQNVELDLAKKRAQEAARIKSEFLANMSHELRTPLNGVIGFTRQMLKTDLSATQTDYLQTIERSANNLLTIINDVLDFSKLEAGKLVLEHIPFALRETLDEVVVLLAPSAHDKGLELTLDVHNDVPEQVIGDSLRLQQIITNLLGNAIKFTDTGCIVLQVCTRGSYLEFSVRDTGVGIPEKEISRLFDPFFQVGTGVQRHFQGTGLGLAICEKLVNLMDGDVSVESEPGLGSLFSIRIPLFNAQFPIPQASDTWQGRRLWLDIRNQRLESYLMAILGGYGADIQRYDGQETAADEVMLSDYPLMLNTPLLAQIQFSTEHIGPSLETRPGYWMHSTSTPRETLTLINRLFGVGNGAAEALVQLPVPAKASAADNGDIHLLVVDDHPINRRLLSDQLGSLGYQVVTANDGVDALAVLKQHHVDIVLTDVNMPNMDGYRLTQALREMQFSAPVIGVTANALAEEKQRCLEAGMDNCLSKPVTLETLEQTLAYYSQQVRYNRSEA